MLRDPPMNQAEAVSRALNDIVKCSDTQPILHLITLIPGHTAHLLTLSPNLSEVFTWWEKGPGLHTQSGACFNLLTCLFRDVLQSHPQLLTQIVSIGRRVVKERLHCVYQALSKYSSTPSRRHCLEFLTLLNCLGGSTTRLLLDDFNFGNASLKQMLANPGPVHEKSVQFMLSFLCVPVLELKMQFMRMKNTLRNMTNLLNRNSVNLKIELLTVLTEHILAGNKIPKKLKCQFFVIPSLVKLSQLWANESVQVQAMTGEFFRKLFDKRCGILFDCPLGDLYSGVQRNPILLVLLKNTTVKSAGYQDFLVDMVRACPEVFPLLVQEKLPALYSEGSLCRLLGARDVDLSNVPDHITDRQIADHIVPKRISDHLEKELKTGGDRVKVRAALLPLVQSAARAVQSLVHTRIREYVMCNLCDISVLQQSMILDTTLALHYLRVDKYCLTSVKSLFQSCDDEIMTDDGQRLLLELCPTMLANFVKHHTDLVCSAVMTHGGPVSGALLERILSVGVTSPQQRKLISVICSLVFDDYSDFVYQEQRLTADVLTGERLCLVTHLLSNVTEIDRLMQEFISSGGGSHSGLMGCKEESLLSVILLTSYRYRHDDKLQYKGRLDRALDTRSPVYLIASHLLSNREQFTSLAVDKSEVTSLERYCHIFAHMTCDSCTESGMLDQFLHVFDEGVMELMSSNPDNYATVISLLNDIVTALLDQGYKFTDLEALRCVVLSQWVRDVGKVVMSHDTVDDNDTVFLDSVRCHIGIVAEFSRTHRFTVTCWGRLHHVLNILGDAPLDTQFVSWLLTVSDSFARDIVMYVSRVKQLSLHTLLRNDTELLRDDKLVSARVTWLSLLEEMLTGVSDHALFGLDQSELDIGALKHFTVLPEELDRISNPQILHKILPRCILSSETAPSLIERAIALPCPQFFISRHFLNSEHFSACAKSKKILKDIFVVLVGNCDLGMFATFMTRHVSLYEENLPVFVRKQIDTCLSDTIREIQEETTGSCKKMEMFTLLLSVFLDLVKNDQLERAFSRIFNLSEVQKLLISDEESSGRDALVKLIYLLLASQRITQDKFTSSHFSVFQRAYQATTSAADKKLSAILKHLDSIGVRSQYPFGHSVYMNELHHMKSVSSYNEYCIKILENLEEEKMTSLINNFPLTQDHDECDVVGYDVHHLLSLLLHILNKCEVDVRIILSSPISRVALLSLSSHDDVMRRAGYDVIDKLSYKVDDEKFKDKSMCVYLFNMIRNSVLNENERLPHLSTYFLGVFLQTLLCPQKHTYPAVCHFLLQRPVFDFGDMPMFYSMFCSSSQGYQQEQNWLLGHLVHAVKDEVDYKILTRRHVLSLCFSQKYCHVVANSTVLLIDKLFEKVSTIKSAKVKRDMLESGLAWHLIAS